jgi:hypothetical protein
MWHCCPPTFRWGDALVRYGECYFRLPPQCKWDLRSSGILRRLVVTEVSRQPPETSVTNSQSTLRNIPEERESVWQQGCYFWEWLVAARYLLESLRMRMNRKRGFSAGRWSVVLFSPRKYATLVLLWYEINIHKSSSTSFGVMFVLWPEYPVTVEDRHPDTRTWQAYTCVRGPRWLEQPCCSLTLTDLSDKDSVNVYRTRIDVVSGIIINACVINCDRAKGSVLLFSLFFVIFTITFPTLMEDFVYFAIRESWLKWFVTFFT